MTTKGQSLNSVMGIFRDKSKGLRCGVLGHHE